MLLPNMKINKIDVTLHEIKNPLTTIIFNIQYMLIKNHFKYKDLKRMKAIEKEALRIKDLIINYLNLHCSKNGWINLNKLIDEVIYIFKPQLEKNLIVTNKKLLKSGIKFFGEKYKLKQVLVNLFKNAISACTKDSSKIEISTLIQNKKIHIKIKDTGCGIADQDLPKIFNPFFTRKLSNEGNGLGLFIASEIVKDYGGEIEVKSKIGKGSSFIIKLPIA